MALANDLRTDLFLRLSVVIPVYNEAENIRPLIREINDALSGEKSAELIYVDDGSTDGTVDVLNAMASETGIELRILEHGVRQGQSSARPD